MPLNDDECMSSWLFEGQKNTLNVSDFNLEKCYSLIRWLSVSTEKILQSTYVDIRENIALTISSGIIERLVTLNRRHVMSW